MTETVEVPSPFCGIGTDDLSVTVEGIVVKVTANGCAINTPAFEEAIINTRPTIDGEAVTLEKAIAKAADLLRDTNQPVIGGCATDVNGMRALLSLADRNGAVVDSSSFNAARRNILAMQDSGWMNTTLAELKNRCDFLLVVGTDLESFAPRFFELYLWNEESMFLDDTSQRQIVYLGKTPSGDASTSPTGQAPLVLACENEDLPQVMAVLRALLKGHLITAQEVAGIAVADLQDLADKMQQASYGVVTWAAGAFDFHQAELTVQVINETIKDLNHTIRFSGFPLGGKEGDQTANQVCGWTTGYPARVSFAKGYPVYDPYLNDSQFLLADNEADALLWVNAFNSQALPPTDNEVPTIVVGRSGMVFDKQPEVFIPVGTPGIDHSGHAYRLDNVVAIRLKKLRDANLPSTAEVLSAIEQAL